MSRTEEKNSARGPASLIYFPRKVPHRFLNGGTKPLRILWTITPGGN